MPKNMVATRGLFSFLLLLFHLGCFIFSSDPHHRRRRRYSSFNPKNKLAAPKTVVFSFFKRLFSSYSTAYPTPPPPPIPSPPSSLHISTPSKGATAPPPLSDIHPCPICGQIFQATSLLDLHYSTHHPISDLIDGENIIRIIFNSGWPERARSPNIHRILKIHNSSKIIARFEEHRERVKSRAAASKTLIRDGRCAADGNELLRFHCTTFVCELDSGICSQQYCSLCGIIRSGFSPKMDGISTLPTGYTANLSIPDDIEEEFGFMHVRRALLVCRVIAGRIGCDPCLVDKEDPGFDSLAGRGNGGEDDELLVFSPWAVLPCFAIVYTV